MHRSPSMTIYSMTALFESIGYGKEQGETINPKEIKVDEKVYENLGASLMPYSSYKEGIKYVEEFLDSDSSKYIVDLPKTEESIFCHFKFDDAEKI